MRIQNEYHFYKDDFRQQHKVKQKKDTSQTKMEQVASFSVGESNQNKEKTEMIDIRRSLENGAMGVLAYIRDLWADKIVKPMTAAKNKIKTIPTEFIRKFNKGKEAFTSLTREGPGFSHSGKEEKKKGKHEEIDTMLPGNAHLTDSYNKSGRYCQIQDNLTYQKPKTKTAVEKRETEQ